MKFRQRVDKLSKGIAEIRAARGGTRVCFQEHGQTKEEAMKAAGIEPDDDALTIFVIKFASPQPDPDPQPTMEQLNAEIARREANPSELYQQVPKSSGGNAKVRPNGLLTKAGKIGQPRQRISETERISKNPEPDSTLDPQPMRADELGKLLR